MVEAWRTEVEEVEGMLCSRPKLRTLSDGLRSRPRVLRRGSNTEFPLGAIRRKGRWCAR